MLVSTVNQTVKRSLEVLGQEGTSSLWMGRTLGGLGIRGLSPLAILTVLLTASKSALQHLVRLHPLTRLERSALRLWLRSRLLRGMLFSTG